MLKGFAITPVVEGRIGIGEIVESNGRRLPKKLDHIVITKMHQSNGSWGRHPEMDALIAKQQADNNPHGDKLRSIPVRIMFDKPENNFRAEYTCFDDKARPICTGDGEKAKRRSGEGVQDVDCPGSDMCEFGANNRCKQFGRLMVGMESSFEKDPLVGFMFRTTSFNSIRSLSYRLNSFEALTGGKMAGMPCNLVMKAKSTAASFRKPIFYLDLEPSGGLFAATAAAQAFRERFEQAGLSRDELEKAVSKGLSQSAFFEGGDDGEEVVEEFRFDANEIEGFGGEEGEGRNVNAIAGADGQQEAVGGTEALPSFDKAATCSAEDVATIHQLLEASGRKVEGLLDWLVKAHDFPLADLTAEEAARSIAVLTPKAKPAAQAEPAGTPQTDAEQGKATATAQGSDAGEPKVDGNKPATGTTAKSGEPEVKQKRAYTRRAKPEDAPQSASPVAVASASEPAAHNPPVGAQVASVASGGNFVAQIASESFF